MRVLFLTADSGGCKHYRCDLPAKELNNAGHTAHVVGDIGIHQGTGEIVRAVEGNTYEKGYDVVVLQRWMREDAGDVIRRARALGQVVINDVDDWFFGLPTANAAFMGTHSSKGLYVPAHKLARNPEIPGYYFKPERHDVNQYRKALAASTAITVSTPYLAQRLKQLGVPIHVLPNMIDIERWEPRYVSETESPTIGWAGAVSFRSPGDLPQIAGSIGPFLNRHPKIRFAHIGRQGWDDVTRLSELTGIPTPRIDSYPFTMIEDLPKALHRFDVALAPLEDTPFNRSKSWIKILEASAAGLPFIASDMPEYRSFSNGSAGILCRRPRDWTAAFERILDPEERRELSEKGRARAEVFDIRNNWQRWERCYENLIKERAA